MLTALLFMLAAPPAPDPEAERLRIAVAVAIEIAKAKEKKPAPKVDPTPAKPTRYDPYGFTDYAKFLDQVKRLGKTGMCVLVVGIEDKYIGTYQCHCRVSSGFGGFEDGEYDCWYENGNAMMQLRKEVKPAATPFPRPATTPGAAGVVAPPPATAARPFVSLGAGLGALRVAPYSGSHGCTSFG